ncbi:MAG TPA: aminopeptidase P family protein [Polyangium sp.]|nr:aminopeptidase P family protein [Polyangium sp.]
MPCPRSHASVFVARRRALQSQLSTPAIFAAGLPSARNYRANTFTYRAASHFLYLVGAALPGAALLLTRERAVLFAEPEAEDDALWHGAKPSFEDLLRTLAVDEVRAIGDLDQALAELGSEPVATLPPQDAWSAAWLSARLGQTVLPSSGDALVDGTPDAALAEAMIALRLCHDVGAVAQMRAAAEASVRAHLAGMRATRPGESEHAVCGAMIGALRREGFTEAYESIVTIEGEVLHHHGHENTLAAGDLLLADVGGESPEGWAADITRTWPVSGTFSSTQRAIYDVVLATQRAAIDKVRPGVSYRDVHETAKRMMVTGLRDLGIFRGDVDGLLERGAHAIFFPHGIGHLLGLDVHDMEDLGDRAGYARGRVRSANFGDRYLRLDRDLIPGMAVTIEPGFYQVPAILRDKRITNAVGDDLRRDELAKYSDVRGIRIEDDVLCTAEAPEVLTAGLPKNASDIEAAMRS